MEVLPLKFWGKNVASSVFGFENPSNALHRMYLVWLQVIVVGAGAFASASKSIASLSQSHELIFFEDKPSSLV